MFFIKKCNHDFNMWSERERFVYKEEDHIYPLSYTNKFYEERQYRDCDICGLIEYRTLTKK